MKNILHSLMALAIILVSIHSAAQTEDSPISIGVFGGLVDFYGDVDQHTVFDFGGDETFLHGGGSLDFYVNRGFDFGISVGAGHLGHITGDKRIEGDFTGVDLNLKYKFANGTILKQDAKIAPYIFAGGGVTGIWGDSLEIDNNLVSQFSYGAGISIPVSERMSIDLRNTYRYLSTDAVDLRRRGINDNFMTLTAGLKYNLGKKADRDGDGIADRNDLCPDVAGLESMMGCPDTDGDGVADQDDACPNAAGTAAMKGCPDSDGDGVSDADDKCPDAAGLSTMMGCPDSDGDGLSDADDKCPKQAGLEQFMGCPDTDGDGITDADDKCPTVLGLTALMGCPDKDKDGIADNDDKCPDVAGIAKNAGCPEITEAAKEVFAEALKGIQFESARDVIKGRSYGILNNVVEVMNSNPAYKLYIQGHTDSQGDDDKNMALSQKRADAVKTYLMNKGIGANRMRTKGFGETVPVADNATAAGRAKNRRVEFKVEF